MDFRDEFDGEKQSSETAESRGLQGSLTRKGGKPESIDSLVARFLEELGGISSEIERRGNPDAGQNQDAGEVRASTKLEQQGSGEPVSPEELDRIQEELEKSLVELEALKISFPPPKEKLVPDALARPSDPAETPLGEKTEPDPPAADPVIDSEEIAWRRMDHFRTSIAMQQRRPRFSIGWVLAAVALVAILVIAILYIFDIRISILQSFLTAPAMAETVNSEQAAIDIPRTTAMELLSGTAGFSEDRGSVEPANNPAPESGTGISIPAAARHYDKSPARTAGFSGSGQSLQRAWV